MVIEDIEDAVEQYHKKLITGKGLVKSWHGRSEDRYNTLLLVTDY